MMIQQTIRFLVVLQVLYKGGRRRRYYRFACAEQDETNVGEGVLGTASAK